jgi:cytochrome b pre-mRNA-processing protein 3
MPAFRPLWGLLKRRDDPSSTASELYGRLVTQARTPALYAELGAPDTPDGRLELVILHLVLLLRRLADAPEAADLSRALTETFVTDVDDNLREMGVSDIGVPRKVKKAAAAVFDRSRDYGRALDAGDAAELSRLLALHVLPPAAPAGQAEGMARYMLGTASRLAGTSIDDVRAGRMTFPEPAS